MGTPKSRSVVMLGLALLAASGMSACVGRELTTEATCEQALDNGHATVWSVEAATGAVRWRREVALVEPWPEVRNAQVRLVRTDGKGTVRVDAVTGDELPTLLALPAGDDAADPPPVTTPREVVLDGVAVPARVSAGDLTFDAADTAHGSLVARGPDGTVRWSLELDRDRAGGPVVLGEQVLVVTADALPAICS